MVFGSAYCGISGLEIQDGDICMMLPLEFYVSTRRGQDMEEAVFCPFQFSGKPTKVKFMGNFGRLEYADKMDTAKDRNRAESFSAEISGFFMLVHLGLYEHLVANYAQGGFESIFDFRINGISPTLISDIERMLEYDKRVDFYNLKSAPADITTEEKERLINAYMTWKVPEYLTNLAKIVRFMAYIGKRPYPNDANDQHGHGALLKKYIREVSKKKKNNDKTS